MTDASAKEASLQPRERVKTTPLPKKQLAVLCIILLTDSICSTMLIPFVGLYVSYMMNWSVEKAGYSAGCLVGLFMLGQVVSAKQWGYIGETFGRKFAIILGVSCCAFSVFLFGLSTNIFMCAFWRFMHGVMTGCSLVAKTVIVDVTDHTNQSNGFALVSLTWGIGTLIGPSVGGLFYDPAHQNWLSFLNLKLNGFWALHPAFLPSLLAATYNVVSVVICVLYLEETNRHAKPLSTKLPRKIETRLRPYFRYLQPKVIVEQKTLEKSTCATDVITVDGDNSLSTSASAAREGDSFSIAMSLNKLANDLSQKINHTFELRKEKTLDAKGSNSVASQDAKHAADQTEEDLPEIFALEPLQPSMKRNSFGFKQAFACRLTRNVCIISMLISASDMIYTEVFPLWVIAPFENGGLNLSSSGVGILILVNSIPSVIANMCYSKILSWFTNPMLYWSMCQLGYGTFSLLVPHVTLFPPRAVFWCAMLLNLTRKVFESWTFATLMLTVARCSPSGQVSIMYGIQQSVCCFVRCIVPFVFAPLLAWSISEPHPYPFDHHFTFILSLIPLLISAAFSIRLKWPDVSLHKNANDNHNTLAEPSGQDKHDSEPVSSRGHARDLAEGGVQDVSWVAQLHGDEDNNILVNNSFVVLSSSFAGNAQGCSANDPQFGSGAVEVAALSDWSCPEFRATERGVSPDNPK